ncbi:MAG: alpha/beta fold hydrolase, partial [Rhodospirillales bacterium]
MSMNISDVHLIHRKAEPETTAPPILFIHGAFAGAWCWDEYFLPWFANAGFDAYAIDLPGRRNRPDVARLQDFTISAYQDAVFAV